MRAPMREPLQVEAGLVRVRVRDACVLVFADAGRVFADGTCLVFE